MGEVKAEEGGVTKPEGGGRKESREGGGGRQRAGRGRLTCKRKQKRSGGRKNNE